MKHQNISFRVYDNQAKEYNGNKEVLLSSDNKIYRIHTITGELQQLNPEALEVEFLVGLKDVDGTEIYENDIVRAISIYGDEVLIIKRDKDGWFLATKDGDCKDSLMFLVGERDYRLKVIGNVHENSELLGD